MELRDFECLETRAEQDGNLTVIRGHAATFSTMSRLLAPEPGMPRQFWESISPGAFADSIANRNVYALVAHDKTRVLGSTKSGTLNLREDEKGLYYEVNLPNTTYANDLAELCRRGDLTSCSFGFKATEQEVTRGQDGFPHRRVDKLILGEISLGVAMPAYDKTSMNVRSVEEYLHDQARIEKLKRINMILSIIDIT